MPKLLRVRLAVEADLPAINEIYNYYVLRSTCTYQRDPDDAEQRAAWFREHGPAHPVTVAEQDGVVVGWGALSSFRDRWGYRHTVENSVYVRAEAQRTGIGSALLVDLIERARALGHRTIIAGISADQTASLVFHGRHGFAAVALLREVGHKFDTWLDVVFLQLML